MRTRNGGRTWRGIPAPKAALDIDNGDNNSTGVHAIRFANSSDGWVFGTDLWATHDGGAHWHAVAKRRNLSDLETGGGSVYYVTRPCDQQAKPTSACTDDARVYAAATGSDTFRKLATVSMKSPDGGVRSPVLTVHRTTWWLPSPTRLYRGHGRSAPTVLADPCKKSPYDEIGLAAADAIHLDALCIGNGAAGSIGGQLRGSSDGGATWRNAGGLHLFRSDVSAVSDNGAGVLIVAAASGDSEIARTVDDGRHFSTVLTVGGGGIEWYDAGFTTASQAFAVLRLSRMYLSHDAGASWHRVSF